MQGPKPCSLGMPMQWSFAGQAPRSTTSGHRPGADVRASGGQAEQPRSSAAALGHGGLPCQRRQDLGLLRVWQIAPVEAVVAAARWRATHRRDRKRTAGPATDGDILLPKLEDEILHADLRKATAVPARSLLFNIDLKFDGIGGTHEAPILEVFMKVLNELQGYDGNQGSVAQFEHHLDRRGQCETFKQTDQRLNRRSWENDRDALATGTKRSFARAYAEPFGGGEDDAINVVSDAVKLMAVQSSAPSKRLHQAVLCTGKARSTRGAWGDQTRGLINCSTWSPTPPARRSQSRDSRIRRADWAT